MQLPAAYITIILVWSTTPLALKWSTEEVGFLFGAASRMALGLLCVALLCLARRQRVPCTLPAVKVYAASAFGIFGAMFSVYWSAQYVPSGWIAIIFGLSPLFTSALSALLLGHQVFTLIHVAAHLFGLAGLAVIFYSGLDAGPGAALGIAALVAATAIHSLSAVLVKRYNQQARLSSLPLVTGGLALAVPVYVAAWLAWDGALPDDIPLRVGGAILYLGTIATTVGFSLYYFVLARHGPTRVALISFVSPIAALMLGRLLNAEALDARVLLGAGLALTALMLHEVIPAWLSGRRARLSGTPPGRGVAEPAALP